LNERQQLLDILSSGNITESEQKNYQNLGPNSGIDEKGTFDYCLSQFNSKFSRPQWFRICT